MSLTLGIKPSVFHNFTDISAHIITDLIVSKLLKTFSLTRFISISNSLPKTSYVKMIDIWLIFNLTIPFIEVHCLLEVEVGETTHHLGVDADKN